MKWFLSLMIITLAWDHEGADFYTVYLRTSNLITFVQATTSTAKQASFWIDGRRNYEFYVTATRRGLTSNPSEILVYKRGY